MTKISRSLEPVMSRLEKFWLYETSTFYYLVGFDNLETSFRLLKINRAIAKPKNLSDIVHEDLLVYNKDDMVDILGMIHEGNKSSGGLVKVCVAYGLVGFVKFLDCFYFTLITQKKEVGCIGGNFIYSVKATEIFAVRRKDEPNNNAFSFIWRKLNKRINQTSSEIAESHYMSLFQFIDMTKDFFFSYTYDLTHSLQHNYITSTNRSGGSEDKIPETQEIFEWNHYQTNELREIVVDHGSSQWVLPIIHGSYQQKRFSLFGKTVDMMVLARRSRHYAGTRYLKRGISVHGKVANDCEVEQVLQYDEGSHHNYCSYVQMRGSIPTYWYQETSVTMPKPPILLNRMDPDYLATEEHFSDLICRYSTPIIVLDLVKQFEKRPRESIVGREFRQAVEVLNESIEEEHKIRYIALDYSKITSISKGKGKHKGGGEGSSKSGKNAQAERAMAAAGNEWAMLESSLARGATTVSSSSTSAPKTPNKSSQSAMGSGVAQGTPPNNAFGSADTLTNFDETPAKDLLSSKDPAGGGVNFAPGTAGGGPVGEGVSSVDSKLDVLRELEDIANLTLSETQYFCTSLGYLDKIKLVTSPHLAKAKAIGYTQQSGVLRTNCIDCLDRTNGGQFAVAMKFLAVSLQSLGICSVQQAIEPDSQLLLALMEMFGVMGDRIAIQYGGSEAHKKVLAGKNGQKPGAPKQNELLTSIKRYYSNAFTDNAKQDAMNVFLGWYVPASTSTPLWDLESDFHLHNLTLRPPDPAVCHVLFEDIVMDNRKLRTPKARAMIESAVRSIILKEKDRVSLINVDAVAGGSSGALKKTPSAQDIISSESSTAIVPAPSLKDSKKSHSSSGEQLAQQSSSVSSSSSASSKITGDFSTDEIVSYVKAMDRVPTLELKTLTSKYFIRNVSVPAKLHNTSSKDLNKDLAVTGRDSPATAVPPVHSPGPPRQASSRLKQASVGVNNIIRSIARLEKRKLTRRIASEKILAATEQWWVGALQSYNMSLYGSVSPPTPRNKANSITEGGLSRVPSQQQMSATQSYFQRVYQPDELTEFDLLFALDFMAPTDAVQSADSQSAAALQSSKKSAASLAEGGATEEAKNADDSDVPALPSSTSYFFLPGLMTNARDPVSQSSHTNVNLTINVDVEGDSGDQLASNSDKETSRPGLLRVDSMGAGSDPTGTDDTGYAIGRFVRDLGMKARTLVGGLMRKEDSANMPMSPSKSPATRRNQGADWNWKHQQISYHMHRVPRSSIIMYSRYVAVANDNLILMHGDRGASRFAEEEYGLLLREYTIDMDNVAGMEHLSVEGCVSSDIHSGVYQGMKQYDSAFMSSLFLMTALVNVESELSACRVHIDQDNNTFTTHQVNVINNGQNHNISTHESLQRFGRQLNSNAKKGKLNMELTPETQERIYKTMKQAEVASGLESEFKRIVSNYIFQQYSYSKDISLERLSKRMSTLSNERTILEYTMLFDQDTLASSFDHMQFITADTASYQSFAELDNLQASLGALERSIAARKRELLDEIKQAEEATEAAAVTAENINSAVSTLPDAPPAPPIKAKSVSEQLGLSLTSDLSDLHAGLDTDYSLDNVFTHYPYNSSSSATVFGREHEYPGFTLQATDLYSRTTNTHLSMNEICVVRFNEALSYR